MNSTANQLTLAAPAAARDDARFRDAFAAVAHRLRNPLASIMAAAEMLEADAAPQHARFTRLIRHEARRVDALLATLHALAALPGLEPTAVDLRPILERAMRDSAALLADVRVNVNIAEPRCSFAAIGNAQALEVVCLNLIANAGQALARGGRLNISLARRDDAITLTFADNGPGFPETVLDRIAHGQRDDADLPARQAGLPVYRPGKPASRQAGAGLGLIACKAVIEQLGGQLIAANASGGACVSLELRPADELTHSFNQARVN